jgi:3-oxoacyl-[acyl-carrier protein] reductase
MSNIALITGSSRGIGAACAKQLKNDGFDVVITYNKSKEKALLLADELRCKAFKCDVSESDQVSELFNTIGSVSLLVCCAGIAPVQKLLTDTTEEEWDRVFATNVKGAYLCCREAIPNMVRKKCGNIILFSSIWGIAGASCEAPYSASKAALIALTKSLAKELGPSGIRVNCVAPGVIATDMNSHLSESDLQALKDETPLGTIGTPDQVASLVSYLASPQADFITGQVISPNGGFIT